MSAIPFGQKLNLRYVPNVSMGKLPSKLGYGGMYAHAKLGLNQPLEIAAQVPDYMSYQTWEFGAPTDKGIPIKWEFSGGPKTSDVGTLGFCNDAEAPGTVITLGLVSYYDINILGPVENGVIATISPTGPWIGVDRYIGVTEDNQLVIVPFPIGTEDGLPGWFFPMLGGSE